MSSLVSVLEPINQDLNIWNIRQDVYHASTLTVRMKVLAFFGAFLCMWINACKRNCQVVQLIAEDDRALAFCN